MIETIGDGNNGTIAIIVYKSYDADGIQFLTPNDFSLQLGYMKRAAGYTIQRHVHLPFKRETVGTQEVLFIRKGRVIVDFYTGDQQYRESRELSEGDFVLLAGAGHGIRVLDEAVIVEVKNGPYAADQDKTRF